jgi:hypothetical protein
MLWGIDELLTYHYLISEFFMIAPSNISVKSFAAMSKEAQADLIWEHLFVKRSPVSEAQIGVLTTLNILGLGEQVRNRDLIGIRQWYKKQSPHEYARNVFRLARVKYAVMTNIPFDTEETAHWLDQEKVIPDYLKTALRIDPILNGDWGSIVNSLKKEGLEESLEGAKDFLRMWVKRIKPLYLMASTPHDFCYGLADKPKSAGWPSATDLIDNVMVPVAKELQLPLALKLGASRGMSPSLSFCGGGDGVVIADVKPLRELCLKNPDVKFLATFLSKVNQHEVCVLSQKLRNLHIYGCWWYLNNPSMIDEITRMRVEMLGTAFTAQHSDCRVLDQILYKWKHSRSAIAVVLEDQFIKLYRTGWQLSEDEIVRDITRLLGGSFEEFLEK